MTVWNFMQVELVPADLQVRPMIGPGELTRERAHTEIQGLLDRMPQLAETAAIWRRGAEDDTVYYGPFVWTIYQHEAGEDSRKAALVWLEDFAATMRTTGLDVGVARFPD